MFMFLLICLIFEVIFCINTVELCPFDAELDELSLNSCSKQAVVGILPQCIEFGIESVDSVERVRLAVSLSVCEFESAGVSYPHTCQGQTLLADIELCVLDLELSPQFWTTFSGNYRELGKICSSFAQPHAKDQILEVLRKITNIYTRFMKLMDSSTDNSTEKIEVLNLQLEILKNSMENTGDAHFRSVELIKNVSDSITHFRDDMAQVFKESKEMSNNFVVLFSNSTLMMEELQYSLHKLGESFSRRSEMLDEILTKYQDGLQSTGEQVFQVVDNVKSEIEIIHEASRENLDLIAQAKDPLVENFQLSIELNRLAVDNKELLEAQQDYMSIEIPNLMAIISEKIVIEAYTSVESLSSYVEEVLDTIENRLDILTDKFHHTEKVVINILNDLEKVTRWYKNLKEVFNSTLSPLLKGLLMSLICTVAVLIMPQMVLVTILWVKHISFQYSKKYRQPQDSNLRGQSPKDF